MKVKDIVLEQSSNINTAQSIARDIHTYVQDMNFHLKQHGADQHFQTLRREVQDMIEDLADLGWEYDPDRPNLMVPLTLPNQVDQKLREAPLPPKAQRVLWRLKHGLDQPGIQLSKPQALPQTPEPATNVAQPTIEPVKISTAYSQSGGFDPSQSQYLQLKKQIAGLEQIQALFVELEKLIDRAQRSPGGIDRGTQADLDIIHNWPVPETTEQVDEYSKKMSQGVNMMREYLRRKRMIWR